MDNNRLMWVDALALGDPFLDTQHRELIERIAKVPERSCDGDAELLQSVFDYATTHFAEEEAFMAQIGFPGLDAHRKVHKKLMRLLASYHRDFLAGQSDLATFKQFMITWIKDHILVMDREIAAHARQVAVPSPNSSSCPADNRG
jgi:hemerythrin